MEHTICSRVAYYEQAIGWFIDLCRHVHCACMHVCTYACVLVCVKESQFNSIHFNSIQFILRSFDP